MGEEGPDRIRCNYNTTRASAPLCNISSFFGIGLSLALTSRRWLPLSPLSTTHIDADTPMLAFNYCSPYYGPLSIRHLVLRMSHSLVKPVHTTTLPPVAI